MAYYFGKVEAYDAGATDALTTKGYWGCCFDGQFVYFSPFYDGSAHHGKVLRLDVFKKFKTAGAWAAYDAGNVDALTTTGFKGAVFDGRFVYFVPYQNDIVLRLDTEGRFKTAASWDAYDVNKKGFQGAVFDGRFIYFAPYHNGTSYIGEVLRYDTEARFKAAASWETYDASATDALTCTGYSGAVFDGRFVYFIPLRNAAYHGNILRYDTTKPFTAAGSWEAYALTGVNADAKGFGGAAFAPDRGMLYLAGDYSTVARYEVSKPFKTAGSWETYHLGTPFPTLVPHARGVFFQNNFTCLAPYPWSDLIGYDENLPFKEPGSWAVRNLLDTDDLDPVGGYTGVVGTGPFFYLCPYYYKKWSETTGNYHGIVARLRKDPCPTQSPPSAPSGSQSFLKFYEDDRFGQISRTTARATASNFWPGDCCFVFRDYGPNMIKTDLEIKFDVRLTYRYSYMEAEAPEDREDDEILHGVFSISNIVSDIDMVETDEIVVTINWDYAAASGNYTHWLILEGKNGYEWSIDLNEDQTYYCLLERDGATVTLKIYSDSARTTLLDTLTITVGATTKHRYLYGPRCGNEGWDSKTSFWIENLNIVTNS